MLNNKAVALRIFAPTTVVVNEEFEFTVEAWDYCERLSCGYAGTIELEATSGNPVFTYESYTFQPSGIDQGFIEAYRIPFGDGGMKKLKMKFGSSGIHYITISDGNCIGYSNPIVVSSSEPTKRLYWGDIHGHTSRCDGSGYLDQVYYYAKEVACLDFAAISTHDHFVNAFNLAYAWRLLWADTKAKCNYWNQPENGFVTFQSYEYRGEFVDLGGNSVGDSVIYSRGDDIPYFSGAQKEFNTPNLLYKNLAGWSAQTGTKVMTIPHHPPYLLHGMRQDWSYFNSSFTHLAEIYSVHGSSEINESEGNIFPLLGGRRGEKTEVEKPGYYIKDALAMGHHIGFMASGDAHDGHLGHSISHTEARHLWQPPLSWSAYANHMFRCNHWRPNGLIAVYANNLTREGIYDAMWSRSCYGMKGVSRIYVDFKVNGKTIGDDESIISIANKDTPRTITFTAASGGGDEGNVLESIQIIKNNKVIKNYTQDDFGEDTRVFLGSYTDNEEIKGISYNYGIDKEDGKYYITEEADIGSTRAEMSTKGEDFYYLKVFTTGSDYYTNPELYPQTVWGDYYVPKGGDMAWIGPIWVHPMN